MFVPPCFVCVFNAGARALFFILSLLAALPISTIHRYRSRLRQTVPADRRSAYSLPEGNMQIADRQDRKSTRLNSSHTVISYADFCSKKKKKRERGVRHHRKQLISDARN